MRTSDRPISASSAFRDDLFAGRVIVIAGATSELGRVVARELGLLGAGLALLDGNSESLSQLKAELDATGDVGGLISTHCSRTTSVEEVAEAVSFVLLQHGRIDGLINDAGALLRSVAAGLPQDRFDQTAQSILFDRFAITRAVHEQWMAENGGTVVNLISELWQPCAYPNHSITTRKLLQLLTETSAADWHAQGISVNAIAPAVISEAHSGSSGAQRPPWEQVVSAITFLLSPAGQATSGACLEVGRTITISAAEHPGPMRIDASRLRH